VTSFCDASAIVKQYVPEPGAAGVDDLGPRLIVSDLSAVEVPSAIWRKQRDGTISAEDAGLLVSAFDYDLRGSTYQLPRYATVRLSDELLDRAAELLPRHELRASDAIQLASALAARDALEFCDTFVTFDRHVRTAAAASGFFVVPAEPPDGEDP
jgi:uncharacterized protein